MVNYPSGSSNTARLVAALGVGAQRIPIRPADPMSSVPDRSVLNRPSYAAGDGRGAVPKQVIRFLNSLSGRALLRSIWADVFARKLARTDKNEIARRVREAAEMLGLSPISHAIPVN
ncbi:class Ib ribonucleoside-diphosphate reductase assembly flavoprotein NrdI [Primorskyibacter flagellatus]|uniref:class Ib ribonucleoside-diphosphate reductase assembly flavoprotein NrdI n=1 Tax=Primorskyibacter flagellatus TaxID=1387277 RepID=UPI003A8F34C3